MFWDKFYSLCIENNTKPNPLAKELGISSGIVTKWKQGGIPNGDTLKKIADRLGTSVDYLLGRTDNPSFKASGELDKTALKFALFGNTPDISDDDMANVLRYAQFIKENKKNEK